MDGDRDFATARARRVWSLNGFCPEPVDFVDRPNLYVQYIYKVVTEKSLDLLGFRGRYPIIQGRLFF